MYVEGDIIEISCRAKNSYPPSSLLYYMNGIDVTDSAIQVDTENAEGRIDSTSTLRMPVTRSENEGTLRCEAAHPTLEPPFPNDEIKISVECK